MEENIKIPERIFYTFCSQELPHGMVFYLIFLHNYACLGEFFSLQKMLTYGTVWGETVSGLIKNLSQSFMTLLYFRMGGDNEISEENFLKFFSRSKVYYYTQQTFP